MLLAMLGILGVASCAYGPGAGLAMAAVAALACVLPATRIDPLMAIRRE